MLTFSIAVVAPLFTAIFAGATPVSQGDTNDIPDDVWAREFMTANATGEAIFQGRNISDFYGYSPTVPWSYTIQVKADIPTPRGQFLTGTWIQLKAPDSLVKDLGNGTRAVQFDRTWHVCQQIWISRSLKSDKKEVDASCDGILSSGCQAKLQTSLGNNFAISRERRCRSVQLPEECESAFGARPDFDSVMTGKDTPETRFLCKRLTDL
jgi:hypothetical protein